jgi:hypothetical protein
MLEDTLGIKIDLATPEQDQGAMHLFVLNAAPDAFEELRAHVATILSDYEVTLAVPEPAAGSDASSDKATLRGDEVSVSAAIRYASLRSPLFFTVNCVRLDFCTVHMVCQVGVSRLRSLYA